MGKDSRIEWCHHTFNHIRGCSRVSEGCRFCYSEALSHRNPRTLGIWGPNGTRVAAAESAWRGPSKWDRAASRIGERHRVFCASLADVFEDWQGQCTDSDDAPLWVNAGGYWSAHRCRDYNEPLTLDGVRVRLFRLIAETPNLDWLLLTKRPENALKMMVKAGLYAVENPTLPCPQENLWVGASVEDQASADERIPHLLNTPAAVRFLSCEPLLGPVDIHPYLFDPHPHREHWPHEKRGLLHWIIAGGESGPGARPMHPNWADNLRADCERAGVAFFFKQWGEHVPCTQIPRQDERHGARGMYIDFAGKTYGEDGPVPPSCYRVVGAGKKAAGRLLDGRTWDQFPEARAAANPPPVAPPPSPADLPGQGLLFGEGAPPC